MSLPPFRRLEPADHERPLSASAEELTKDWIVRLIEHTPLEQVRKLPTERIAREGPAPNEGTLPGREVRRRIEERGSLRDEGELTRELPRDVAALEPVLLRAVKERLSGDPEA